MRKGRAVDTNSSSEVGYGKPPISKRFQKGHSGNPKGRPKGSQNALSLLSKELAAPIQVLEMGKQRTISKRHAYVKQIANKAVKGDHKAIALLLDLELRAIPSDRLPSAEEALSQPEDAVVIRTLFSRLQKHKQPGQAHHIANAPKLVSTKKGGT